MHSAPLLASFQSGSFEFDSQAGLRQHVILIVWFNRTCKAEVILNLGLDGFENKISFMLGVARGGRYISSVCKRS